MFVHPSQVHEIARRHPQIRKARLVVSGRMANDEMTLHCEVENPQDDSGIAAMIATVRELTKLRGEVRLVAIGSLAQDGKVIDDIRDYS
jgi:phenylacetate-CoA ligase